MIKSPKTDTVVLSYPHSSEVSHSFSQSLMQLMHYDSEHMGRIKNGAWNAVYSSSGGIVNARNSLVKQFLKTDNADWLFWIDTDMGFKPDALEHLIEWADPDERPIMGGLCFAHRSEGLDGYGGQRRTIVPTAYTLSDMPDSDGNYYMHPMMTYPSNRIIQCDGTGAAFLLVHRSVYEKIGDSGWYDPLAYKTNTKTFSEDLSFCLRARSLDIPIHVHTGVRTTHLKECWLSEIDHWKGLDVPNVDTEVDVLVCCQYETDYVGLVSLVQSVRSTTSYAHISVVVDDPDHPLLSLVKDHVRVIPSLEIRYDKMINTAARKMNRDWIVVVRANARFKHGWLDHALNIGVNHSMGVVGLNDGTERALEGYYSDSFMIRREYLKGSLDNTLFDSRLKHFWIDGLITTASKNSRWEMSYGAEVIDKTIEQAPPDSVIQNDLEILNSI